MFTYVNDFLSKWEPIWLFLILFTETGVGFVTLYWIIKEYAYDEQKDLKKQKRTKTKKTTTNPGGSSVVEETEIVEEQGVNNETPKA